LETYFFFSQTVLDSGVAAGTPDPLFVAKFKFKTLCKSPFSSSVVENMIEK
jgi:hypothetical protein